MKKSRREFRANSSGQLLIICALTIAVLISSTTIYVYELNKETNSTDTPSFSNFILALKQSTRNTMISSLANISNGGERAVLTTNLNDLSQVFRNLNHFGLCHLDFTVLNDSTYDSGTWLSWNTSDLGVSSTYANFTLNFYGAAATIAAKYAINITTTLAVNGSYVTLEGETKLVSVTCKIFNEDEPALVENVTLFHENLGNWTRIDASNNLTVLDIGNGTYLISFTVTTSSDPVKVSVHAHDLRDILVKANTTCYAT